MSNTGKLTVGLDALRAPKRQNSVGGSSFGGNSHIEHLLTGNREWSLKTISEDPEYFAGLSQLQAPEYLWIGCSDSRVPANTIMGLRPGEVFVQRNVGNQAGHQDMNYMSCLEYAVKELKVKTIIVCGHYGCGAVKAALRLPSKTPGLVNCWISDIRACRNEHQEQLQKLADDQQVDRLCELNVLRQTFHVCTSPVVQSAWDQGQQLEVYGFIYSLRDGRLKSLAGPLRGNSDCEQDLSAFEGELGGQQDGEAAEQLMNTVSVASKLKAHAAWADGKA